MQDKLKTKILFCLFIIQRRHTRFFFECETEIICGRKPWKISDFFDRIIGINEQFFGFVYSQSRNVFHYRAMHNVFELFAKRYFWNIKFAANLSQSYVAIVVCVYIINNFCKAKSMQMSAINWSAIMNACQMFAMH